MSFNWGYVVNRLFGYLFFGLTFLFPLQGARGQQPNLFPLSHKVILFFLKASYLAEKLAFYFWILVHSHKKSLSKERL
jgi:hypothetical protein